jgi:hypothetical protein
MEDGIYETKNKQIVLGRKQATSTLARRFLVLGFCIFDYDQ